VLSTFSRLLIDPNRGEDDPTLVMRLSDGTVIPGNHPISTQEIEHRLASFYRPYHETVDGMIDRFFDAGITPAILSVHSFTGSWRGVARPWHATLLWDNDPRFTRPLLDEFAKVDGLIYTDNEPYDGALRNDSIFRHGAMRGLAHTLIEIRQDLVGDENSVRQWVELLAPMLEKINALAEMHEVRHFDSRTGPLHLSHD
jgi:predicted N-formylglutamate amidohydrolase